MASVSLTTLLGRARERADMVSSDFITDAKFTDWINRGLQMLWEKLIAAYDANYFEKQGSITLVDGTSDYSLPSDFFKLYGIDWNNGPSGTVVTLRPYTFAERNAYRNSNILVGATYLDPRYHLGRNAAGTAPALRILPANISGTLTVFYAPILTVLVSGSDTVDVLNGWEEYAVIYAAIQALNKEESSVTALQNELDRMEGELVEMANGRDIGQATSSVDVAMQSDWWGIL